MIDHVRHIGIYDASELAVSLVGAGGIGAITALTLAKMGVGYLEIYDGDKVAPENLATQFHRIEDLDRSKAFALVDAIKEYADGTVFSAGHRRIEAGDELYGNVVISAVDSIQARKDIWAAVQNGHVQFYIDARMAAEEMQIYTVDMSSETDLRWYDEKLAAQDDATMPELPCTARATFYCAAAIAGVLGAQLRKIVTGRKPERFIVWNLVSNFFAAVVA